LIPTFYCTRLLYDFYKFTIAELTLMENSVLSQRELRRYKPQIDFEGIGLQGQVKIKQSKVLVVGAGGKGTTALKTLITAGVGYIGISDDTLIREETLGRQSLYGDNDIGKQKAIVSKQYLKARNQFAEIKVHNIRLTADNLVKVLENYDIIIDATNNFPTHYAISDAAKSMNKPLVFSAIQDNRAIVAVINSQSGKVLKDILADEAKLPLNGSNTATPAVIINALTGVVLANEALKLILDIPSQLHSSLLVIDALDYSFNFLPID
jgi:molybdopterin/thiamine biosynthesis adenylyltransferase